MPESNRGEIVIFDRAYVDFVHLGMLNDDGVFWVTRSKSRAHYPEPIRRVRALVEVEGKEREMEFLTNNLQWSAGSVADLYSCRWQIEVFFKQIKQSLQLCDFLGKPASIQHLESDFASL